MRTILDNKEPTRVMISRLTGLNQATVTNIVADLIDFGLVEEIGLGERTKGRRPVQISFSDRLHRIIGLHVTRRYFTITSHGLTGTCYRSQQVQIPRQVSPEHLLKTMLDYIGEFLREPYQALGIGIAVPGPVFQQDYVRERVSHFKGWERIRLRQAVEERFGLPVFVEQDAKAIGLMAWEQQEDKANGVMICVEAGQGIGAAVVDGGRLFKGALGGAGEIGHMCVDHRGPVCECGSRGCLEKYCSTIELLHHIGGLAEQHESHPLRRGCTWEQVLAAYHDKDSLVVQELESRSQYLGIAVANLINALNPSSVVVSGELAGCGERLLQRLIQVIRRHTLPSLFQAVQFQFIEPGSACMSFVGGNLVLEHLIENPQSFLGLLAEGKDSIQ